VPARNTTLNTSERAVCHFREVTDRLPVQPEDAREVIRLMLNKLATGLLEAKQACCTVFSRSGNTVSNDGFAPETSNERRRQTIHGSSSRNAVRDRIEPA
jgi:hypothetical protein